MGWMDYSKDEMTKEETVLLYCLSKISIIFLKVRGERKCEVFVNLRKPP